MSRTFVAIGSKTINWKKSGIQSPPIPYSSLDGVKMKRF
jgi:hypothetical protein